MRLLHRDRNGQIGLTDFKDKDVPEYAILSHTHGSDEVTIQDLREGNFQHKHGYKKLEFSLGKAKAHGLDYCWIDSSCLDPSEDVELCHDIYRMFTWYQQASSCYVFLSDVPAKPFEASRWFKRGWTALELIAPKDAEFFSCDGRSLGTKQLMVGDIEKITGIPASVLQNFTSSELGYNEMMKSIGGRSTEQEEDMAYSEMGLALRHFPAGLEPFYQQMAQRIKDDEDHAVSCGAVLQAVVIARRPLDQAELGFVAGLDESVTGDPQAVYDIVRSCGSFLKTHEGKVYLVDQSAKDFLINKDDGHGLFQLEQHEAHCRLSKRLLETMSVLLKKDICNTDRASVMLTDVGPETIQRSIPPYLQYACCYWADHAIDGGLPDTESDLVESFFDNLFLCWLEALSTIGKTHKAKESVDLLLDRNYHPGKSTSNSNRRNDLRPFLLDCRQFLNYGRSGIEQAPLQVYSSALMFAPFQSLVRRRYAEQIPRWMRLLPRVKEEWVHCSQNPGRVGTIVMFSPDGQILASGLSDGTVKVWDVAGRPFRTFQEEGPVHAVAFSPKGKTLASGGDQVRLWEVATGCLLSTLKGHTHSAYVVAFSPDGRMLAAGTDEGTVRLWDVATGSLRSTLKGHSGRIEAMAFSPDGQTLICGSKDRKARLWDTAMGSLIESNIADYDLCFIHDGGKIRRRVEPQNSHASDPQVTSRITIGGQWIFHDGRALLWLPDYFRTDVSTSFKSRVALGYSETVMIMEIDPAELSNGWK